MQLQIETILNPFKHFLFDFQVNGAGKTKRNCFSMEAKRELEMNLNSSLNRWFEKSRMKINKAPFSSTAGISGKINTIQVERQSQVVNNVIESSDVRRNVNSIGFGLCCLAQLNIPISQFEYRCGWRNLCEIVFKSHAFEYNKWRIIWFWFLWLVSR